MSVFKKRVTRQGATNFFKDGKAVDAGEVPVEVHALLAGEETTKEVEFDDTQPENTETTSETPREDTQSSQENLDTVEETVQQEDEAPKEVVSYLSGEPATRRRWLNGRVYHLTQSEYESLNLGKLAQAIREKDAETVED